MRIDGHQHFWNLADRAGQWPPAELAAIHRDFTPADLKPHLAAAGIDGTVLVQSLPSLADTHFMLDLADREPFILGVVGWADLKAVDAPAVITELSRRPKLKGLRPMLQDLPNKDWIDDPALGPAIAAMEKCDLAFDALVKTEHLPALARFAARHPGLRIVIDHGAKPDIAGGDLAAWRRGMEALAGMRHVCCKLSGLLTEAGTPPDGKGVEEVAARILDWFGATRVLFGSDWPVLKLAGQYESWAETVETLVERQLGPSAIEKVFSENAQRFYRL